MFENVYTIATITFQVNYSSCIEKIYPFHLFKSKRIPQIFYSFKNGLPKVNKQMVLLYKDDKNQVYVDGKRYFRYIGGLSLDSKNFISHSCLVYSHENYHLFDVYMIHETTNLDEKCVFGALGLEQVLGYHNLVVLHSSYIIYNHMGIVFSAPSQTGKSTQARLWKENMPNVEIINGDRSVIGEVDGKIIAFGLPFCGTSEISFNNSSQLKCIVILRQGKDNKLKKLSRIEAFKYLYSECSVPIWDEDALTGIITSLEYIISKVPVYLYSCVNDKSAVEILYKVL